MNRLIVLILFILSSTLSFSQKYMDEIVENSCSCVSNLSDSIEPEEYTMELGLCMINVSIPFKKQLKKDFGIDMDNIAEDGEKLGGIIGSRMVGVCPEELMVLTKKSNENDKSKIENKEIFKEEGIILNTENDFFISFYIKSESGKTKRYYWLNFIETTEDLAYNYKLLEGKRVGLSYTVEEYFDPKILDYRSFFIIKQLKVID